MSRKKAFQLLKLANLKNPPRDENWINTVSMYAKLLADIPPEVLLAAVEYYITQESWFPTVADLRAAVAQLAKLQAGLPTWEKAWGEVVAQLKSPRIAQTFRCEDGAELGRYSYMLSQTSGMPGYWQAIDNYDRHVEHCPHCYTTRPAREFSHPVIAQLVADLGLESMAEQDLVANRAHFIKAWASAEGRATVEMTRPQLGGGVGDAIKQLAGGLARD